ncbi:MAG: hypothetical protein ACREKN_07815 [Longimicrobiaceae bacterium]
MNSDRVIFQDERGRGWLVEVLHGHPVPSELGVVAARFRCPEDPEEPVRVGFLERQELASGDEPALRRALADADPASEIGG